MKKIEFTAFLAVSRYDAGDVCVSVDVTDDEIEHLKKCYEEEIEIEECDELSDLVKRVRDEAISENGWILDEMDSDEEFDYDNANVTVYIPDEISDLVDAE